MKIFPFFMHIKSMYFNYHAKVKKLIEDGHAMYFEVLESYHNIQPCLLIYFDNNPPMPIREHKFEQYIFLLAKHGVKQKNKV